MEQPTLVKLKQVTHFREFPFGTIHDPSMREATAESPQEHQKELLEYLRSGCVLAIPMSADLPDWFAPGSKANPLIEGRREGGVTPLTDGVWFWPAGLIHFVEKYNVKLPREFVEHAARNGWRIDKEAVRRGAYDYEY